MGKDLIQKSLKDSLFTGIIALALFGPIVGLRTVAKNEVLVVEPKWLIEAASRRQKWIDQSQSHNVFMQGVSGKKLSEIYTAAWKFGLKTTYYLRTLAASQIEKSTLDANKFGYTQKREYKKVEEGADVEEQQSVTNEATNSEAPGSEVASACSIMDPDCEACQ